MSVALRYIKDRQDIAGILQIAQDYQWVLAYSALGEIRSAFGDTKLVRLEPDRDSIAIGSEVRSADLIPGNRISFQAQSGGIHFRFESKLIPPKGNAVISRFFSDCRIEFPEAIQYAQLRQAIRVNLSDRANIQVTFFTDKGSYLCGLVKDISSTGMKIKFHGNFCYQFKQSRTINDCHLLLPDGTNVITKVKALGLIHDEKTDVSLIRCQFLEMEEDGEARLNDFIDSTLQVLGELNSALPL